MMKKPTIWSIFKKIHSYALLHKGKIKSYVYFLTVWFAMHKLCFLQKTTFFCLLQVNNKFYEKERITKKLPLAKKSI